MHDLDELRRRLWLAVFVGTVGCEQVDPKPADQPQTVADNPDETKPTKTPSVSGGMSALVDGAVSVAAANAEAKKKIEAAEKAAFAASTCTVVVNRLTAALGTVPSAGLEHGCPPHNGSMQLEAEATERLRDAGDEDNCCYAEIRHPRPVRGRPYPVDGAPRLPGFSVLRRADPSAARTAADRRVAAGWLHDAREELASVAAFERFALELAQLGAPRGLIDACAVAAAQEHRHARLCLSVAEEFAARPLQLGAPLVVEPRRIGLLALLLETFEAGCAGEAIAAAIASRSARGASDRIRRVLVEIAADETEHAALAWSAVAWGVPRLTAAERVTFFAAARRMAPPAIAARAAAEADCPHGRMSPAMQAAVAEEVWSLVIVPLLDGWRGAGQPRLASVANGHQSAT